MSIRTTELWRNNLLGTIKILTIFQGWILNTSRTTTDHCSTVDSSDCSVFLNNECFRNYSLTEFWGGLLKLENKLPENSDKSIHESNVCIPNCRLYLDIQYFLLKVDFPLCIVTPLVPLARCHSVSVMVYFTYSLLLNSHLSLQQLWHVAHSQNHVVHPGLQTHTHTRWPINKAQNEPASSTLKSPSVAAFTHTAIFQNKPG